MSIKFLITCVRLYTPSWAIGFSFANLFFTWVCKLIYSGVVAKIRRYL